MYWYYPAALILTYIVAVIVLLKYFRIIEPKTKKEKNASLLSCFVLYFVFFIAWCNVAFSGSTNVFAIIAELFISAVGGFIFLAMFNYDNTDTNRNNGVEALNQLVGQCGIIIKQMEGDRYYGCLTDDAQSPIIIKIEGTVKPNDYFTIIGMIDGFICGKIIEKNKN